MRKFREEKVFKSVKERELSLQEMRTGEEITEGRDLNRRDSQDGLACKGDAFYSDPL